MVGLFDLPASKLIAHKWAVHLTSGGQSNCSLNCARRCNRTNERRPLAKRKSTRRRRPVAPLTSSINQATLSSRLVAGLNGGPPWQPPTAALDGHPDGNTNGQPNGHPGRPRRAPQSQTQSQAAIYHARVTLAPEVEPCKWQASNLLARRPLFALIKDSLAYSRPVALVGRHKHAPFAGSESQVRAVWRFESLGARLAPRAGRQVAPAPRQRHPLV